MESANYVKVKANVGKQTTEGFEKERPWLKVP